MRILFNDDWLFSEKAIDNSLMEKNGKPNFLNPTDYKNEISTIDFAKIEIPHDWMISHVKDLYKNSIGFYKKNFTLNDIYEKRIAIEFEGVYMNSAVYVNDKLAGIWKYGYSTFQFDITNFVQKGENTINVIAVYQCPNTRWYSGAGIFRDVNIIITEKTFLPFGGTYITNSSEDGKTWKIQHSAEIAGKIDNHTIRTTITDASGKVILSSKKDSTPKAISSEEQEYLHTNACGVQHYELSRTEDIFTIENPILWDLENPYLYKITTELIDKNNKTIDSVTENTAFRTMHFDKENGFFLNDKHVKIFGACQHHDLGALGSAFNVNALRRQFNKLKEMGVNSVRCSHNPPTAAFLNLADEMGILIDDESFDMWEKPKTTYDYGNYFNDWCEKDAANWVRKDRNHPCLMMWSIGNEIYDTHVGNGLEITKKLVKIVRKIDYRKNAPTTIASNYMMTDGAQKCGDEIDVVGYNYLERLYDEHHQKHSSWVIYGSETGSTVQSRGIYHFPEDLTLVTFDDQQCSSLGNCTTTWGARSTEAVITKDRDTSFSFGQYIWTGWDYIGEPTPYHTKNSYFGQIDTAGFPKDTFFLYKSEWTNYQENAFVHILPYWDFNENQDITVKAYTNAPSIELFFNNKSLGKIAIDHEKDLKPYGQWNLKYHEGELKAIAYDKNGKILCEDIKRSFTDPENLILQGETEKTGNIFFIDVMSADKNNTLVENARNYVTINVEGDAVLLGMDNGDSTDYDEYQSKDMKTHSRKLFANRLVAIIKSNDLSKPFSVTAASKDLPNTTIQYAPDESEKSNKNVFVLIKPNKNVQAEKDFVPTRNIKITIDQPVTTENPTLLTNENKVLKMKAEVLPANATNKEIVWTPVLKESVTSDFIEVQNSTNNKSGIETATIKAFCDGECRLRCTAKNGQDYPEIISDLEFTVKNVGNPKKDPYKLIEACRMDNWDKQKEKPPISLLSGISNRNIGSTWISFDKVDFQDDGSDSIHIPFFSFDTTIPFEVWDGIPNTENSECLLEGTYNHESIYNTYSENVFTLKRRLFGVHTISVLLKTELEFQGFYFDKTLKAYSKLCAIDANRIVGDTFTKTKESVEGIGNNVNLDFEKMNFGTDRFVSKLTIYGKSNNENNTINVKFLCENESSTQIIEFPHTNDYEEKTFEIKPVSGNQNVSFVFLPGCNFDFKWFKFE